MAAKPLDNEIISLSDVVKSPRGRKKVLDKDLLSALQPLKPGQAMRMKMFGQVPSESRADVSGKIRKHFIEAHGVKPSINYSPEGFPQVSFRKDAK